MKEMGKRPGGFGTYPVKTVERLCIMLPSMKQKFQKIYLVLIGCVVIFGCLTFVSLRFSVRNMEVIIETNYRKIQALDQMLEMVDRQDSAVLTYLSVGKEKGIDLYTKGMQDFLKWFYVLEDYTETADAAQVETIRQDYDLYCRQFSLLQEEMAGGGESGALSYYDQEMSPLFDSLKNEIRRLRDDNINRMLSHKEETSRFANGMGFLIFILTATTVWISHSIAMSQVKNLLLPLEQLCDNLRSISAGGSFCRYLEAAGTAEVAQLATEFNNMLHRLQEYEEINTGTLMAEKQKLESIIRSMEDVFLLVDSDMQIETMNPAAEQMFGVPEEAARGRHILETIHDQQLFHLVLSMYNCGTNHQDQIYERDDRIYHVVCCRVRGVEDTSSKYTLLLQDVTNITKTEKLRRDFIATVSHELKTPLTTMQMGASLLSNGALGKLTQEQETVVDAILDDVDRISGMVEDLVELTRLQSGNVSYQFEAASVEEVAQQAAERFAERVQYSGVQLELQIPEGLPLVLADPEKLGWVFNNILNNAFQYTSNGDRITISVRREENVAHVVIQDTGLGIPLENQGHLFEGEFHWNEDDREHRGSGVGLYLSKKIIEAHGGAIFVQSTEGEGSAFHFTLPWAPKASLL